MGAVIDPNMKDDIQVTVISTGFNTMSTDMETSNVIEKSVPTRELQDQVNEPLHAQKDNSPDTIKEEDNQKLIFDDTKSSTAIYEKRLEVPAFLRKQQNG